jgi:hypothetical protein
LLRGGTPVSVTKRFLGRDDVPRNMRRCVGPPRCAVAKVYLVLSGASRPRWKKAGQTIRLPSSESSEGTIAYGGSDVRPSVKRVERRSRVRPRRGKAGWLELQFQWVRTVTAGKDADTRIPVSRGLRGARVIFRPDTPGKEPGQGTNGDPQRGADQTDHHGIAYRQ